VLGATSPGTLPQIKKLVKPTSKDGRKLGESYAVELAVEAGLGVDWLMGRAGQWRKPLHRFSEPWTPEMYLQIQETKQAGDSLEAGRDMCAKHFLVNSGRLAQIILAGFKQKKANLVLSRIHLAFTPLAREFRVGDLDVRTGEVLKQAIIRRKPVDRVARGITRRFWHGLSAVVSQTATKASTALYRLVLHPEGSRIEPTASSTGYPGNDFERRNGSWTTRRIWTASRGLQRFAKPRATECNTKRAKPCVFATDPPEA